MTALHEATEMDERYARYVNDNLADYLLPVNADVPSVEVIMLPELDDQINPAGVKASASWAMSEPMLRCAMRSSTPRVSDSGSDR
jgi:CO/xanthine dehydrogenase Mo-binding subunit